MTVSKKGRFKIDIIRKPKTVENELVSERDRIGPSDETVYNFDRLFDPVQKKTHCFICVDHDENFVVRLLSTNPHETEVVGVVLYLDGRRMPGKRIFKRVTLFPGVKMSKGKILPFSFVVPKPSQGSPIFYPQPTTNASMHVATLSQNVSPIKQNFLNDKRHRGKNGTIIAEFLKTQRVEHQGKKGYAGAAAAGEDDDDSLETASARKRDLKSDDKHSEAVNRAIQPSKSREDGTDSNEAVVEYKILYQQVVDSVELNFSSWGHLTCERVLVRPTSYQHLRLTPPSLFSSSQFLTRVIWVVLKQLSKPVQPRSLDEGQPVPISRIENEVYKATGHKIKDYFKIGEGELAKFLGQRPGMFRVTKGGSGGSGSMVAPIEFDVVAEFRLNDIP